MELQLQLDKLKQENNDLKKQIHETSIEIQYLIEQDIDCPSDCSKLKEKENKLLLEENQELKKQLEEINDFINKANFANIEQLMLDYCAKAEEQEDFIEYLEKMWEETQDIWYVKILNKYKEIIGEKDE